MGDVMKVGATVVVKTPFKSNSKIPVQLEIGQVGLVKSVDADGDVEIDFRDHSSMQWVFRKHFDKLEIRSDTQPQERPEEATIQETSPMDGVFGFFGVRETTPPENQEQPLQDFFGGMFGGIFASGMEEPRRPSISSQDSDADSMMTCDSTRSWATCQEGDD